jgi:uncharacterized protein (TIGR02246 family)
MPEVKTKSTPTPEAVHQNYSEYFRTSDLEGLVSLYEPNAVVVAEDGAHIKGTAKIREMFEDVIKSKGTLKIETLSEVQVDGLASVRVKWHLQAIGSDGNELEIANVASEVMRKQPDGNWLYIIDQPCTKHQV